MAPSRDRTRDADEQTMSRRASTRTKVVYCMHAYARTRTSEFASLTSPFPLYGAVAPRPLPSRHEVEPLASHSVRRVPLGYQLTNPSFQEWSLLGRSKRTDTPLKVSPWTNFHSGFGTVSPSVWPNCRLTLKFRRIGPRSE